MTSEISDCECRYFLLKQAVHNSEPSLLVGETGTGKTTACQLLSRSRKQRLHIINCNQHTETSDFLGGYRPNQNRISIFAKIKELASAISTSTDREHIELKPTFDSLNRCIAELGIASPDSSDFRELCKLVREYKAPFQWTDGPLVEAMRNGDMLLIDELNLAEDAVLERLNR